MPPALHKYPRTPHIEGSRLGIGDEDRDCVPFAELAGRYLVVEEKLDGANSGVRFDAEGKLWLQSRGHYLLGGEREKHFSMFKAWAHRLSEPLRARLGKRFVMFGETLSSKH